MATEEPGTGGNKFMLDFGQGGSPFSAVTVEPEDLAEETSEGEIVDEVIDDQTDDTEVEESPQEEGDAPQQEEVQETDQVDEDAEEEEEGEDDEGNLYYHIGLELKQDAFLPEDLEIGEDIDASTLKDSIKVKLREELEPGIRNEVYQNLINQGYSEQDLVIARAIRQGVDPRLLSTASMYETYSIMEDDVDEAAQKAVISQMYRTRGLKEDEIDNLLKVAADSNTLGDLYTNSRSFFKSKYDEFLASEKQRNDQLEQEAKAQSKKANQLISNVIRSRKIKDVEMTPTQAKEFEGAIRNATQVIEANGQRFQASEVQEFLYNFQVDDELKLLTFFLFKFREQQADTMKKKAKQEVETEFLKGYKQRTIRKSKASKSKKPIAKEPAKRLGNTYVLNVGGK